MGAKPTGSYLTPFAAGNPIVDSKSKPEFTSGFPTPVLQFQDSPRTCPYLSDQTALMPLVYPMAKLDGVEFDRYLALGRRRSSSFLYHTACPACSACEPSRVLVQEFEWTESMRRVLRRAERELRIAVDLPTVDEKRVELFNRHRTERGLGRPEEIETISDYGHGFVETCCDSIELSFWRDDRLVGISIVDCGEESVSAVYTFFDPSESRMSIGTYSILRQIDWTAASGRKYLYLGMYVGANDHLRYKARFTPQERMIEGQWIRFD